MPSQNSRGIAQNLRAQAVHRNGLTRHLRQLCLVALSVVSLISGCTSTRDHPVAGGSCARRIAYTQETQASTMAIIVRSECGALIRTFVPPNGLSYAGPAMAPNGQAVTFLATSSSSLSNTVSLDTGNLTSGSIIRLRVLDDEVGDPSYSPDGHHIALFWVAPHIGSTGSWEVCTYILKSADGSVVSKSCYHASPTSPYTLSWSPNGNVILESGSDSNNFASSTVFQVRVADLAARHLELTPRGDLIGAAFSPDSKSVLLDYAPQHSLAQLWNYDIATGQLTQLTDVSDGIVAAAVANNWTVYYRSGSGTKLYQLNLQNGRSRLIAVTPPTTSPELSIQQGGPLRASPSIKQPIVIHHSALGAFLGIWGVHDGGLCIGGILSVPLPKVGQPPCSGAHHSGWLEWYVGYGIFTASHIPIYYGYAKLAFRPGPDNTIMVTVTKIVHTTTGGVIVPDFHEQGTLQRGDQFELRAEATGLLKTIYLHTHLSGPNLRYGNPYWCGPGISPANRLHCGA